MCDKADTGLGIKPDRKKWEHCTTANEINKLISDLGQLQHAEPVAQAGAHLECLLLQVHLGGAKRTANRRSSSYSDLCASISTVQQLLKATHKR